MKVIVKKDIQGIRIRKNTKNAGSVLISGHTDDLRVGPCGVSICFSLSMFVTIAVTTCELGTKTPAHTSSTLYTCTYLAEVSDIEANTSSRRMLEF